MRPAGDGVPTYLLDGDGLLARFAKLLYGLGIVAQILLATHEDDGQALTKVHNLRDPLQTRAW